MTVSRALRRLLRVLTIEQEQCQSALESATGELRQLERAAAATKDRARSGRNLIVKSAHSGELPDRLAGLEETHASRRLASVLAPRITNAESDVADLRQAFIAKRVECRQAETLIREAEERDAIVAVRRSQQALDDWYLNRMRAARDATYAPSPVNRVAPPSQCVASEPGQRPDTHNLSADLINPEPVS